MNNPSLEPSCSSSAGEADPAVRLGWFLDQFPQRNTVTTICNDDLSDALVLIAELMRDVFGNPCLQDDIDTDPETPGVQEQCTASDVRFRGTDRQEETLLRKCDDVGGQTPCWRLVEDLTNCSGASDSGLALEVDRGGANVPSGTEVVFRCVVP